MSASFSRPTYRGLNPLERAMFAARRLDRGRALAIVLLLALGALAVRSTLAGRAAVAELGALVPVAIAEHDLDPGVTLTSDDFRWEQWPLAIAPAGPSAATAEGAVVRSAVGAGEPILASRVSDHPLGLGPDERGVTIPVPLAPPPVAVGGLVDLIGLTPGIEIGSQVILDNRPLGTARVVAFDDTTITLAVQSYQVDPIVETAAIGTVEVVLTPFDS